MTYVVLVIGIGSAIAYARKRMWVDMALVTVAALALAGLVGDFRMPATSAPVVDAASGDVTHAAAVSVQGDGLREAQWADLPARPLRWSAPDTSVLTLDFARETQRGRLFTLTVRRSGGTSLARLQLLAENGQLLAEQKGSGETLTVQWLPPVAERLVLQARLLDEKGGLVAQGPVPVVVREHAPLRVSGRFASPSFDLQSLARLLEQSGAVVDWRVVLGKTVTRSQKPREEISRPDLMVVDAAHVERMPARERAALLAQVAEGMPLLVLGGNATNTAFWQRELQLRLSAAGADQTGNGMPLAMDAAALVPAAAGGWHQRAAGVAVRDLKRGRMTWVALSGWHRHAITSPQALALWWQEIVDIAGPVRNADVAWLPTSAMPLPGERLELCAQGVDGDVQFPGLGQEARWQRRPDQPDAMCVAVWPREPGWLEARTGGSAPSTSHVYVYDLGDWPAWQSAGRRAGTALYAARTHGKAVGLEPPLAAWPFALLFAGAMLALWWRERR